MSWFTESNRWKHFLGGFLLGLLSLGDWYTALLVGLTVSSTLELKDKLWGGQWDWIDWIVTVLGCCLGYSVSGISSNSVSFNIDNKILTLISYGNV